MPSWRVKVTFPVFFSPLRMIEAFPSSAETVWSNGEHTITIYQKTLHSGDIKLDNEGSDYQMFLLNETTVYYWHKYNTNFVMWVQDDYSFSLSCHDSVSLDEIKKIISSLEETE